MDQNEKEINKEVEKESKRSKRRRRKRRITQNSVIIPATIFVVGENGRGRRKRCIAHQKGNGTVDISLKLWLIH